MFVEELNKGMKSRERERNGRIIIKFILSHHSVTVLGPLRLNFKGLVEA